MKIGAYTIEPEADLWEANLRGANLRGADLWEANLRGANLEGANLWSHKVTTGPHASWHSSYWAFTFPSKTGRIMRYGCECLLISEWRERLVELCDKHVPELSKRYQREIGALLDLCDVLDSEVLK